jgi:glucose-1-phosphate thymidylyltransferase
MIIIILAGGYGRRLAPLTDNHAKSLLPIAGKPIIDWIIDKLPQSSKIIISTNKRFEEDFKAWVGKKPIEIVCEGSQKEEEKLGAVGGLMYTIRQRSISEPILLVNGDNIFDFSLKDIEENEHAVNILYDIKELEKVREKYGNVRLDKEFIVKFLEKPKQPVSTFVSTGIYYFPPSIFPMLKKFFYSPTPDKDNIGSLLKWMAERKKVKIKGVIKRGLWMDIGSRASYVRANQVFSGKDSYIAPHVKLVNTSITSSVILSHCHISDSELEGCVIDEGCLLSNIKLRNTLIGKGSHIKRRP